MAVKIDKKIKGYQVVTVDKEEAVPTVIETSNVIQMHERIERPPVLIGSTYKIKSPLMEHAMYVTINDITLNAGTEHELRRPFEIFINSKSMEHFQWIVALTRIISAVFRKGGDIAFLVEEMMAVFDPKGGYYRPGGQYMPSFVAELGKIIEEHLTMIGMMGKLPLSPEQLALIAEKKLAYAAKAGHEETAEFPPNATVCTSCSVKAVVIMDGCATCLNCAHSKCG